MNSNVLEQHIEQDFQQQIANVKHDDSFRSAKINSIKNQNKEKTREKNQKRENLLKMLKQNWMKRLKKKIKTMISFDKNECNSIKSIVAKGKRTVDVISRFIKGKMPMFPKFLLKSFVYV